MLFMLKNRIAEVRRAKGMSLEEVAERAGLSPGYVSLMASGGRNISLKNLERLATALDCQPEDLIGTSTTTNSDILDLWASIPPERRDLALTVLQSLTNPPVDTPDKQTQDTQSGTTTKKRRNRNQ
jgi:transcriptional regulator with XRE-family HTH domain